MWKFPQAEAIKGDLKLASYRVEIKLFQAEEMKCAELLSQKRARNVWTKRSLRWPKSSARACAAHAVHVGDLGCFPKMNREPLKGFRCHGAMVGCVVSEDPDLRGWNSKGWGRDREERVQKGGYSRREDVMMARPRVVVVTGSRGNLQEILNRQTD